jgi:hypothetical protein
MKKTTIFLISGIIASMILCSTSIAQTDRFKELPLISISASTSPVNVSARLNKAFSQVFQNATNLRWYELENKFLVKFIMDDRENRALFTRKGTLVYHVAYGSEAFLPGDVRHLVKSNYYDQAITRVLKVEQDKRTIWIISLEDVKDYIWVRVEDKEIEETKRIHKDK